MQPAITASWLALGCAFLLAAGCQDESKSQPAASSESRAPAAPSPAEAAKGEPVEPALLPTRALADLESISLAAGGPCQEPFAALQELVKSLGTTRARLEKATEAGVAGDLLRAASKAAASTADTLPPVTDTDELRRVSDELRAALIDLAESLALSADAIESGNAKDAAMVVRRIQNGVDNTVRSIEGLGQQCAS